PRSAEQGHGSNCFAKKPTRFLKAKKIGAYIGKILPRYSTKLLGNLLLTHLGTSLAITSTKIPGLGERAHNLCGMQELVNERQVPRSRKRLSVALSEMVFLIGNYNKIAVASSWFSKRALLLFRVRVKSNALKAWLISYVVQRAADVNMSLRARRFGHRISKRRRSGERVVERLSKPRRVVSQKVNRQSSNLTCLGHFFPLIY